MLPNRTLKIPQGLRCRLLQPGDKRAIAVKFDVSQPVSRVLFCISSDSHSSRPEIALRFQRSTRLLIRTASYGSLFDLAPGGACRAPVHCCPGGALLPHRFTLTRFLRRSVLCCAVRELALPRRYLAPCPTELGLSSPDAVCGAHTSAATVRPTLIRLYHASRSFLLNARSYSSRFLTPVRSDRTCVTVLTELFSSKVLSAFSTSKGIPSSLCGHAPITTANSPFIRSGEASIKAGNSDARMR